MECIKCCPLRCYCFAPRLFEHELISTHVYLRGQYLVTSHISLHCLSRFRPLHTTHTSYITMTANACIITTFNIPELADHTVQYLDPHDIFNCLCTCKVLAHHLKPFLWRNFRMWRSIDSTTVTQVRKSG
ncbi:hypothetical protein BC939DRAFT_458574 [Gamsiella multidivaricata]|uniref:uncharacterized protein n=1 Tax=Gamsiella multidivaricata TaxID=101098 RepID=UPI00221EF169|nr:uncharacterized protein BC939DRAFT_458574 [Gamsiella multidivaricata]KAI7820184.1 hypothetical protein BC939DRAFT_458574 [Gamsiella multidivaricata]